MKSYFLWYLRLMVFIISFGYYNQERLKRD